MTTKRHETCPARVLKQPGHKLAILMCVLLASACQTQLVSLPEAPTVPATASITRAIAPDVKSHTSDADIQSEDPGSDTQDPDELKPNKPEDEKLASNATVMQGETIVPDSPFNNVSPLTINTAKRTGRLQSSELSEVSGLSASLHYLGVLYAINDSGNTPQLYAIDEQGKLLASWPVAARNRDWEDMSRISLADGNYLVIGDTGDNLRTKRCATLHFLLETALPTIDETVQPDASTKVCFDDGPRNVEAFAAIDNVLYLLSKEPVNANGRAPSGVYRVTLPEQLELLDANTELVATRIAKMPLRDASLETSLAAKLAGVDLTHPTSMAFDSASNSAYILTYREILRVTRRPEESWAEAFTRPASKVWSHNLAQAEALTISAGRTLWFTSERVGAPLWGIPLDPPM